MKIAGRSISEEWLFGVYYVVILLAAAFRDVILTPYVADRLGMPNGIGVFVEPVWKLATWMLPTYLYVRYVLREDVAHYLKLTPHILRGIGWGLLATLLLFLILIAPTLFLHGVVISSLHVDDWLNGVALVGLLEEILFRGVILQHLLKRTGWWQASAMTSLLFVLIHVPLWVSTAMPLPSVLVNVFVVFTLSYVFCYLVYKSGSLWSSIIAHSLYDALILLF